MAGSVHIDPFRDLITFRSAMHRLFHDTFGQPGAATAGLASPAIDLYQTAEDIVVKASLPGLNPKEINISITGGVLTLRGEVPEKRDVECTHSDIKERRAGSFTRTIGLPTAVVSDRAGAQFQHGVLTLRLPKAEEVKPKTITVRAR